MMDSKLFLAIFLGIWLGMTVYYISKLLINAMIRAGERWTYNRAQSLSIQRDKGNETGRIIGFRPIENERA